MNTFPAYPGEVTGGLKRGGGGQVRRNEQLQRGITPYDSVRKKKNLFF